MVVEFLLDAVGVGGDACVCAVGDLQIVLVLADGIWGSEFEEEFVSCVVVVELEVGIAGAGEELGDGIEKNDAVVGVESSGEDLPVGITAIGARGGTLLDGEQLIGGVGMRRLVGGLGGLLSATGQ